MTATELPSLTTAQSHVLTATQVAALTTAALAVMETADLAALTTSAIRALTTDQLHILSTDQLHNLTSLQAHALTVTQLASLTAPQTAELMTTFAVTPIVLDLNGDGVQTVSIDHGVQFDLTGGGVAHQVGWVSANDGFLVLDRNGDGIINSGREMFGQATLLSDGTTAKNGYEALATLDTNHDGIIDARDTDYAKLQVWQDTNQDGVTQTGELHNLTSLGIVSLDLHAHQTIAVQNGNWIGLDSSFTTADGSVHAMADVWLSINKDLNQTVDLSKIDPASLHGAHLTVVDVSGNGGMGDTVLVNAHDVATLGQKDLVVNDQTGAGHIQMMIRGDANDVVKITDQPGVWTEAGTTQIDGETFRILNDAHQHQLLVGVKIHDPIS